MTDIPIREELYDDLVQHLSKCGNPEASELVSRLVSAKVTGQLQPLEVSVLLETMQQSEPEWEREIEVTGWDIGDVAEYAFGHRRRGEPATLELGYGIDQEESTVVLRIGHPKPYVPTVVAKPYGHYPPPEGETTFDDDLLDLPEEPIR